MVFCRSFQVLNFRNKISAYSRSDAVDWCVHASISPTYRNGSCEDSSIGRGIPPGPPRVNASIKPRTIALRRAVPYSSRTYLFKNEKFQEKQINNEYLNRTWRSLRCSKASLIIVDISGDSAVNSRHSPNMKSSFFCFCVWRRAVSYFVTIGIIVRKQILGEVPFVP